MTRSPLILTLVLGAVPMSSCAFEADPARDANEAVAPLVSKQLDCALTEVVSPSEIDTSERGGFTSEGRFFMIGTRPKADGDSVSWLMEVTRATKGYSAVNYLTGTLEGTADGKLSGKARGDACIFSGMAAHGSLLYAGCVAPDGRAALLQIDTLADEVRAGYFTSCNFEPASEPCAPVSLYPNGMAVDAEGRIYSSNTAAYGLQGDAAVTPYSLTQIELDPVASDSSLLSFHFRSWLDKDVFADSLAPNGVEIQDGTLYYVGGANLNAVPIQPDGSAGKLRVRYRGPLVSYIDDFALGDGAIMLARTIPSAVVALDAPKGRTAREYATCSMGLLGPPSSITYQPSARDSTTKPLFPPGTVVVTSFFGGGLYTMVGAH